MFTLADLILDLVHVMSFKQKSITLTNEKGVTELQEIEEFVREDPGGSDDGRSGSRKRKAGDTDVGQAPHYDYTKLGLLKDGSKVDANVYSVVTR